MFNFSSFYIFIFHIILYLSNKNVFLYSVKDDANVEVTHFVLEGTASVIQRLVLERYRRKIDGKWGYRLHNDQSAKVSLTHSNLKIIFMQICKLNEGACFGLGLLLPFIITYRLL